MRRERYRPSDGICPPAGQSRGGTGKSSGRENCGKRSEVGERRWVDDKTLRAWRGCQNEGWEEKRDESR